MMEIRDIVENEEEEGHKFVPDPMECEGSIKWGDHSFCEECSHCGHPRCEWYVEEHHGKGLREEETPAPGLGKTKFEVVGYGDFEETHVGELVRIVPKSCDAPVFHVQRLPSGTIQIYYCGTIDKVDKE